MVQYSLRPAERPPNFDALTLRIWACRKRRDATSLGVSFWVSCPPVGRQRLPEKACGVGLGRRSAHNDDVDYTSRGSTNNGRDVVLLGSGTCTFRHGKLLGASRCRPGTVLHPGTNIRPWWAAQPDKWNQAQNWEGSFGQLFTVARMNEYGHASTRNLGTGLRMTLGSWDASFHRAVLGKKYAELSFTVHS